jgi:hypothetical protein
MNGHEAVVKLLVDQDDVEAGPPAMNSTPAINSTTRHKLDHAPSTRPSRHNLASPPCFKSIPALPLIQVMLEGYVTTKAKRANFGGGLIRPRMYRRSLYFLEDHR